MWPLCSTTPKPLLRIAGRSLLHRHLDNLQAAGCKRTIVVVEHLAERVQAEAAAWRGKMEVACVRQGEPRGTGHAVAAGAAHMKGDAIVVMGDCLAAAATIKNLAAQTEFAVAAKRVPDAHRYGALRVAGDRVHGIEEKSPSPSSDLVNTGLYHVPADALRAAHDLKPSPRGELEFTDVVAEWAGQGKVKWIPAEGWLDVGAPWNLLAANEAAMAPTLDFLLDGAITGGTGTIEEGVVLNGRIYVEAGARVRSGTTVDGDAYIGRDARVGPTSFLRGPVAIGARCHVGAFSEIKNSVILDGSHLPHLHYIGDSVIGEDVNLGAGTIVANLRHDERTVRVEHRGAKVDTGRRKFGAVIGDRAKTGVNSSLNPGTIIGVGAMVRAGAAVNGTVADGELR